MKSRRLIPIGLFLLSALFLMSGCEEDMDMKKKKNQKHKIHQKNKSIIALPYVEPNISVINFDNPGVSSGDIISSVYSADGIGPVVVKGNNPRFGSHQNAAMIFNSNKRTGGDPDLCTPHKDFGGKGMGEGGKYGSDYENKYRLNNVLIISEDLDQSDPDDEGDYEGAQLMFDFTKVRKNYNSIIIKSIDVLDIADNASDESAFIELLDENRKVLKKIQFPVVGDNGYARIYLPYVPFVNSIVVNFVGSGAIDNIAFQANHATCTLPKSYFIQNPEEWSAIDAEETFFLCGHNYFDALANGVDGSGYYILSEHYITAMLNVCRGASTSREVMTAMSMAEDLFNYYSPVRINQLAEGDPLRKMFLNVAVVLDDYNNGRMGPGMCIELASAN